MPSAMAMIEERAEEIMQILSRRRAGSVDGVIGLCAAVAAAARAIGAATCAERGGDRDEETTKQIENALMVLAQLAPLHESALIRATLNAGLAIAAKTRSAS
jgi:hypothetical protein